MYEPAALLDGTAAIEAELAGAALVLVPALVPVLVPSPQAESPSAKSKTDLVRMLVTRSLRSSFACGATFFEILGARCLLAGMAELVATIRLSADMSDVVAEGRELLARVGGRRRGARYRRARRGSG